MVLMRSRRRLSVLRRPRSRKQVHGSASTRRRDRQVVRKGRQGRRLAAGHRSDNLSDPATGPWGVAARWLRSTRVVRVPRRRLTPAKPDSHISRATRLRPTRHPPSTSSACTRGIPQAPRESFWMRRIIACSSSEQCRGVQESRSTPVVLRATDGNLALRLGEKRGPAGGSPGRRHAAGLAHATGQQSRRTRSMRARPSSSLSPRPRRRFAGRRDDVSARGTFRRHELSSTLRRTRTGGSGLPMRLRMMGRMPW